MSDSIPMTAAGHKAIAEEIRYLIKEQRPKVIAALEHARSDGDKEENPEMDAAIQFQKEVEGKISELEDRINRAQIIDPSTIKSDTIVFGATVTLLDLDNDQEVTYQLVGEFESDAKNGKLSVKSPIGRAMIGLKAGDDFSFDAPAGTREFEILKLEYK